MPSTCIYFYFCNFAVSHRPLYIVLLMSSCLLSTSWLMLISRYKVMRILLPFNCTKMHAIYMSWGGWRTKCQELLHFVTKDSLHSLKKYWVEELKVIHFYLFCHIWSVKVSSTVRKATALQEQNAYDAQLLNYHITCALCSFLVTTNIRTRLRLGKQAKLWIIFKSRTDYTKY